MSENENTSFLGSKPCSTPRQIPNVEAPATSQPMLIQPHIQSQPAYAASHQAVVVQQMERSTNSLGIVGFVFSLLGPISFGLTIIVSLPMCLIALFKPPRGLAIAGTIINTAQIFVAIIMFGPIIFGIAKFIGLGYILENFYGDQYSNSNNSSYLGSYQKTEHEANRLAKKIGPEIAKDFDGKIDIRTDLNSWKFDTDRDEFILDVTVRWRGGLISVNQYWVQGDIKVGNDGMNWRFSKSEMSPELRDYMNLKVGAVIVGKALEKSADILNESNASISPSEGSITPESSKHQDHSPAAIPELKIEPPQKAIPIEPSEIRKEVLDDGLLKQDQVANWDLAKVRFEINAIYARHGAVFPDKEIQRYFENQPWYKPSAMSFNEIEESFSSAERYNIELLAEQRREILNK